MAVGGETKAMSELEERERRRESASVESDDLTRGARQTLGWCWKGEASDD